MLTPKRAGIYCRLSYAPDGSLEKVERQEGDCRDLGDRIGWGISTAAFQDATPPGVFYDNNRSAWQRNRKRPGWDRMLKAIRNREIDGVIVYHGDRLIRQPYDLELLLQLTDEYALPLASPSGVRDLSHPDDRFILRIEAAQACRASDDTSRRVKRGLKAVMKAGKPSGGRRPFGFQADQITHDEREAALLAEAARRRLAGQSLRGVRAWLAERCTTSGGSAWTNRSVRILFMSPRIAGLSEVDGELHKAVWEPIISVEEWEALRALTEADSVPGHGKERTSLLGGIAECSGCGKTNMRAKPANRDQRGRLYACFNPDCRKKMGRNQRHLDAYVEAHVIRLLNDADVMGRILSAGPDTSGVAVEIAALEQRRAATERQLAELADHPDLRPDVAVQALESFNARIRELRNRMATTQRQRVLSRMQGITWEQWKATPLDVRAETVRALVRVVVLPARRGPGFDTNSVQIIPIMD